MKNKIIIASVISVAAVLIAVAVLLLIFIPNSFAERMEKADKKLSKDPYTIDVKISFNCYDDEIVGIFSELEKNKTTVYVDGDRFKSTNELELKLKEDGVEKEYRFTSAYTLIGSVLYAELDYTLDGEGSSPNKSYASVTPEQSAELKNEICLIGGVSAESFSVMTDGKTDEGYVAVFSGVSDADRVLLEKMMSSLLEDSADSVSLKEAELTIEITDKTYDKAKLHAEYDVVISGKTYSVDTTVELEFDYDDVSKIYPPDNANEYQENELDKIIG